jgi:CHAD domain-containing protein
MPERPHFELAHAYDPGPDVVVPELIGLAGVARAGYPLTVELRTTHVDTGDLALSRAGVQLFRRTMNDDASWRLEVPSNGRRELREPLAAIPDQVPAVLRDTVQGLTRGRALVEVAHVVTTRTTRELLDDTDAVIAELVDEVGTGHRLGGETFSWRRWELRAEDASFLEAADRFLLETGILPSNRPGVARLLGGGGADPDPAVELGRHSPVGRVLLIRLHAQVEALLQADVEIRRGHPHGVHDARVACRRLRAALATFRPAIRTDASEPIRAELGWLARALGEARDQHVVRERLVALTKGEDEVAGPVLDRILAADWSSHADRTVMEVLRSQRYFGLLDTLEALVADPPWTPRADRDAGRFVRRRIGKEWDRLATRVALLDDVEQGRETDDALHEVRKAAKRLRYALEVAELVWPRKPKRLRRRVRELAEVLGERQDTVVTRAALLELAAEADAAGEPTFTHGRIDYVEQLRAAELTDRFHHDWSETERERRSWP